jgi:C_GCAxxG_C_C family probable redox protein
MSNADKAVATFKEGFSCSQAVLSPYCEHFGLDRDTALKISTGFGGGMHLGQTCGAVTGAIMVIGLKYGRTKASDQASKAKTYEIVAQFANEFKRRHGSITCKDLIGCDVTTPEGLKTAKDMNLFAAICSKLIADAAEILDKIL